MKKLLGLILVLFAVPVTAQVVDSGWISTGGGGGGSLSGNAAGDIDMQGYDISDSTTALNIGGATTTSHALGADDVLVGGMLEVNGNAYFDTQVTFANNLAIGDNRYIGAPTSGGTIIFKNINQSPNTSQMVPSSGTNAWEFVTWANRDGNYGFPLQSDPTLVLFSNTGAGSATDQWLSIAHDQTNGVLETGSGGIDLRGGSTKGAGTRAYTKTESLTFAGNPGDASKTSTATLIPDGDILLGVTTRVTTAGTNCGGFDIGTAGDDDLWGSDIAVAQNTTSDNSDATVNWSFPAGLADGEIVVTGTNGGGVATNCFDMVVAVTSHLMKPIAATSN